MNDVFEIKKLIEMENDPPDFGIFFAHRRTRENSDCIRGPFGLDAYELYVHIEGVCNILVGDRIYTPHKGDIFLYRPDTPHNLIIHSENYERFIIQFSPYAFKKIICDFDIFDVFYSSKATNHQIVLPEHFSKEFLNRLYGISDYLKKDNPNNEYRLYTDCIRVLIVLNDMIANPGVVSHGINYPQILSEIISFIHNNHLQIQGLQEICDHFGISRIYLSKLFERYTVTTPYHYIRELKLNHAKSILSAGGSVTEACFDSGFTDYSNFIRLFRKETGITPHVYKKKYKEIL